MQPPWNFVEEFGIAGNPNKGHSVSSQLDQLEPWYCCRISSILAGLSHGLYSRSRARVALGRELQLPLSFPWPIFPGLDQDLFPPMVFLVFWDSIPKRCKGVHFVDLGESFQFQRIFTCKIWLRYSRERALSSLPALRVQIPQVPPSSPGQISGIFTILSAKTRIIFSDL